jgi:hypothetical protein
VAAFFMWWRLLLFPAREICLLKSEVLRRV